MDISPDSILYAVLAFSWVEYLWEAYIGSRYKNQGPVYVYLELDYENAKYKILYVVITGSGTSIAHAPPCPPSWRGS